MHDGAEMFSNVYTRIVVINWCVTDARELTNEPQATVLPSFTDEMPIVT